ncbi:MAG TPA: hypothetical protein VLC94_07440 [Candidatus Acidoferrum sp.]|nr:hypothetical protein [Candidatus Acidoferrum sp.]
MAVLTIFIVGSLFIAGCGAPGEPQPPTPPIPAPITDLTAQQQGNGVKLVFTLPGRATSGERLTEPPATEIFRGSVKADGKPDNKSFHQVYTIPGALADVYAAQGKIQFTDPIAAEELRGHPAMIVTYRVRTRASKKKDSADSNTVVVKVFPVAEKIADVDAAVTQNAIELSWQAPRPPASNGSTSVSAYHVYRGELESGAPLPSAGDLSQVKWKNVPALLAPTQTNSYSDTLFDFGKTYVYLVRSVIIAEGLPIESDDSPPAIVTPRDTFSPAAPQNVVAAILPGENNSRVVDLSWSINVEPDLAGYRIYRSEKQFERGQLLQTELLLSPSFRDSSAQPAKRYWYTVTAVDRAGNESAPSDPAFADLVQPLP